MFWTVSGCTYKSVVVVRSGVCYVDHVVVVMCLVRCSVCVGTMPYVRMIY